MAHAASHRTPARRWLSHTALALAAATLAACGGGGGGSDPTVTVPTGARVVAATDGADLTVDNYLALSSPTVRGLGGGNGSDVLSFLAGASREQAQAANRLRSGIGNPFAGFALASLTSTKFRERATATTVDNSICLSGAGSATANDNDNDGTLSAGDSVTVNVTDCVVTSGQPAATGVLSLTVNAIEVSATDTLQALDLSVNFGSFRVAGYGTMNGAFRMWIKGVDSSNVITRLRYDGAAFTDASGAGTPVTYNFDIASTLAGSASTVEISGGIGVNGATYAITTPVALHGVPPSSGSVKVADKLGDYVLLVPKPASLFDLEFYGADGVLQSATRDLNWADYVK